MPLQNPEHAISVRVYRSTEQIIPSGTYTAIIFDTERWDQGDMFSLTNPTRLTAATNGAHIIAGHVRFASSLTGYRSVRIRLNGNTDIAMQDMTPLGGGVSTPISLTTKYFLNTGDYIELMVFQNSGLGVAALTSDGLFPEFSMVRVG